MNGIENTFDIIIAGAGPSGLSLAGELRRLGASPLLIDRQPAGANTSRACVVHARTLEVLEPLGATKELLARGLTVPLFRIRDRDRALVTIDLSEIPSRYPFTLMCPQDKVEQCLLDRLGEFGGRVVRPREFVHCEVHPSHADVSVRKSDGTIETIKARWLVGCDGMHSTVREQSHLPFVGAPYEEDFVLADVHMDWPLNREEVTLFYSPDGFMVVAPLPDDHFRIVCMVDNAPASPSRDFMQELLDKRGPTIKPGHIRDVVWSSRFHIHHRQVEIPRKGRVFLCGDAAHVHSPAGGQGMNTGIQDSISLAGDLVATLADGNDARLDRWAVKRHEIAHDVIALTDRMTKVAAIKSRPGQALRNIAVAFAGHLPLVRSSLAQTLAELDAR